MERISNNVYVETTQPGCNPGFVVTKEGVVMIDSPQQPSYIPIWKKAIAENGEIRFLINTEHHRDHIIGNFFFNATIIAHEKTKEALSSIERESIMEKVEMSDPEGFPMMKGFYVKKPTIAFSEKMVLYMGDQTLELIHLPGHTAGMLAVYIPEERVVFTGDNIFHKVQTYLHQAYPYQWLESLKKIEALDVDVIVPGHGDICNKQYIKEQASFINEWIDAVKQAMQKGLTKEEAQSKISFIDRYPMDIGISQQRALEVQRLNVARLYETIKV